MKHCVDCKHYRFDRPAKMPHSYPHHVCTNPKVMPVDLVTGTPKEVDAKKEREMYRNRCGSGAKLFEPKQPPRRTLFDALADWAFWVLPK